MEINETTDEKKDFHCGYILFGVYVCEATLVIFLPAVFLLSYYYYLLTFWLVC